MGEKIWVCATCSQDFTRKRSGRRHNDILHSGNSMIVRRLDYVIGRLTGQFLHSDPSSYRRKKKQGHQNKFGSRVIADTIGNESFCGNISQQEQHSTVNDTYKGLSSSSVPPDPITLQQPHKGAIDTYKQSSDPSEKLQERVSKLVEMKTLLSRYGSPEDINVILAAGLTLDLNSEINDHFIDEANFLSPEIPIFGNMPIDKISFLIDNNNNIAKKYTNIGNNQNRTNYSQNYHLSNIQQ